MKKIAGLLNLEKPTGITSRDVVNQVNRVVGRHLKVGHAGTLDPLASGVLVVCLGSCTRLIEYVQRMAKTYRTVIRLDATSDTLDADGTVTPLPQAEPSSLDAVEAAVASQVGLIEQVPPAFSALKVEGRRAYDLARAGQTVELKPRTVRVDAIRMIRYAWPHLELEIDCGAGTYIRSIARDVGDALGLGGVVEVLVRTRIGRFTLDQAITPETLNSENLEGHLRPSLDAVADLPRCSLDADEVQAIGQGKPVHRPPIVDATSEVALIDPDGQLVALAHASPRTRRIQPKRVLLT